MDLPSDKVMLEAPLLSMADEHVKLNLVIEQFKKACGPAIFVFAYTCLI